MEMPVWGEWKRGGKALFTYPILGVGDWGEEL